MAREDNKTRELVNEGIRAREVRLIDDEGVNHGTVPTSKALELAKEKDLDLVVVSPNQSPPVAKIIDWGKYKYETEKRAKEARKKQHVVEVKEVKMRYKIDTHDYEVRMKAARKFLAQQNKVKLVVMLRGREIQHNKLAFDLANKFLEDIKDANPIVEKNPMLEGKNVVAILAPSTK
ncbi:TPA: translation initiation factor IF-3 [Candidatus Galligastranaerophilus intestinigallinarum]|nr:translation initiation factor IF-3 [Candidatus Galligastranaerophilus intestinigallinarum]